MPATYDKTRGGRAILGELISRLDLVQTNLITAVTRDDQPVEYRRQMRRAAVDEAKAQAESARLAMAEWARDAHNAAVSVWNSDPVGDVATETRRMATEARIARLIDSGQRIDERMGRRGTAGRELAAEAEQAYLSGRYEDAIAAATAAEALGAANAARWRGEAETQVKLRDPDKARAFRELAEVRSVATVFEREANARLAAAMDTAARAARAIGDDGFGHARDATKLSLSAKVAAWQQSQASGEPYVAPEGTLDTESALAETTPRREPGIGGAVTWTSGPRKAGRRAATA